MARACVRQVYEFLCPDKIQNTCIDALFRRARGAFLAQTIGIECSWCAARLAPIGLHRTSPRRGEPHSRENWV